MRMKLHANKGSPLESLIKTSAVGILAVRKMDAGSRAIGGGNTVRVRGPVDFMGVVRVIGKGICFDAKRCDKVKSFPIGDETHFPRHQREFLIEQGEAGSISGLVVEATRLGKIFWLDWRDVRRLGMGMVKSIPWDFANLLYLGEVNRAIDFKRIPGVDF